MIKTNYYYDDRNKIVYTAEQLKRVSLTEEDKKHIHIYNEAKGTIENGIYKPKSAKEKEEEKIQESINAVNNNRNKDNEYIYVEAGIDMTERLAKDTESHKNYNSISDVVNYVYKELYEACKEKKYLNYYKDDIINEITHYIKFRINEDKNFDFVDLISNEKTIANAAQKSMSNAKIDRKKNSKNKKVAISIVAAVLVVIEISAVAALAYFKIHIPEQMEDKTGLMSYTVSDVDQINNYINNHNYVTSIPDFGVKRTSNNDGYWYKPETIAYRLMQLPEYAFLSGLATVYNDIIHNKTSNLDSIISTLNRMSKDFPESAAYKYTHNCKTFEDFLIKNGYFHTDKDNNIKTDEKDFYYSQVKFYINNDELFKKDVEEHMDDILDFYSDSIREEGAKNGR